LRTDEIVFAYSDSINADIGNHVFPIQKYDLIHQKLMSEGILTEDYFMESPIATAEDLLLVHTENYVRDFTSLRWTARTMNSELPLTAGIRDSYLLGTGGTILACQKALDCRVAVNLSGGFHHAFPDHAEGFCYTNDIAIGIRRLQRNNGIKKFFVIDCDVHQGNGTAFIFRTDPDVFTMSIHQEDNYPIKQKSDLDIGLRDRTDDVTYLAYLREHVPRIIDDFAPDLVIYLAGADPYENDKLGGLSLTIDGLRQRDEFVMRRCAEKNIPVAVLLAGGYAIKTDDTVTIHCNTCKVAYNLWLTINSI